MEKKSKVRWLTAVFLSFAAVIFLAAAIFYWFKGGHTWYIGPIKIRLHQWEKPWLFACALWTLAVFVRPGPFLPRKILKLIFDPWGNDLDSGIGKAWAILGAAVGSSIGFHFAVNYRYLFPHLGLAIPMVVVLAAVSAFMHAGYGLLMERSGVPTTARYRTGTRLGFYSLFWLLLALGPLRFWEGRFYDPLWPLAAGFAVGYFMAIVIDAPGRAGRLPLKMRTPLWAALALVLVLSGLFSFLAFRSDSLRPPRHRVLFITLDTVRSDHLSCYGYHRPTSPRIDQVAARGVRFEKAVCPMGGTDMSHASMFTGTYPRTHGIINNGLPITGEVSSLPEYFQERGFKTAAIISRVRLDPANVMGLPGFDYQNLPTRTGIEARAPGVFRRTANWLSQNRDENVFMWIHFFDPHMDYEAHPGFPVRFTDSNKNCHAINRLKGKRYDEKFVRHCIDQYDGEIAYMDYWVGQVLDWVSKLEPKSELPPLIILVGDHGEAMGEYQERADFGFGHGGVLYDGIIRIPMILSWPGKIPEARVIGGVAEVVDLAPTVIDLVFGKNDFDAQGKSLVEAMEGGPPDQQAFVQRWRTEKFETIPELSLQKYAVYDKNLKVIVTVENETAPELYNLDEDPRENTNLVKEKPEELERMQFLLSDWFHRIPLTKPGASRLDDAGRDHLRALGYIQD